LAFVEIRENESLESALKRFKRIMQNAGVFEEARRHERYEKPSDRRRRQEAASERRRRRAAQQQQ
jgi:small subunit ribosomal protein S21